MNGSIDPLREQFEAFKALPRDEPIQMLNLIRLRERAEYPEGHPDHGKNLSGLDAYRTYGRTAASVFRKVGGKQVWAGRPDAVVIGPSAETWDLAFIAEYPSAAAFMAMVSDPEYREHVKHRQAAVLDSRLIRMKPLRPGSAFAQ